jgi:hypothetical protein
MVFKYNCYSSRKPVPEFEPGMGGFRPIKYGTCGGEEKCVRGFGEGNLKGRDPLRELDLKGRKIKKCILKK